MLFFPAIITFEATVIQDVICGFDTGSLGNRDFLETNFTGYFLGLNDSFLINHFNISLRLYQAGTHASYLLTLLYQRGGAGGGLPGGGGGGVKFAGGEETLGPLVVLTGGSLVIFPDMGTR